MLSTAWAGLACCTAAYPADAPALKHNPFSRPASKMTIVFADDGMEQTRNELVLTATMVAGPNSSAHIDGRVVRPGDEVAGQRLLRVYEDRAVLLRDGEEATVFVKPELEESDDQNEEIRRQR